MERAHKLVARKIEPSVLWVRITRTSFGEIVYESLFVLEIVNSTSAAQKTKMICVFFLAILPLCFLFFRWHLGQFVEAKFWKKQWRTMLMKVNCPTLTFTRLKTNRSHLLGSLCSLKSILHLQTGIERKTKKKRKKKKSKKNRKNKHKDGPVEVGEPSVKTAKSDD